MENKITPQLRRQLAVAHGLSEQYLYQCLTGRRDLDHGRARRIESESCGVLTRKMLCQKTWADVWPELATTEKEAANA